MTGKAIPRFLFLGSSQIISTTLSQTVFMPISIRLRKEIIWTMFQVTLAYAAKAILDVGI